MRRGAIFRPSCSSTGRSSTKDSPETFVGRYERVLLVVAGCSGRGRRERKRGRGCRAGEDGLAGALTRGMADAVRVEPDLSGRLTEVRMAMTVVVVVAG